MSVIIQPTLTPTECFNFMCGDVGLTTVTKYMPIGWIDNASTNMKQFVCVKAFTVKGMQYSCRTAHTAAGSETVIFSLMKNENPVSMALIIGPGEMSGDTVGQDVESFVIGDRIGLEVDKSGVILTSPADISVSMLIQ